MNGTCCNDDTLIIQRGDCINVLAQYKNEDGTPIDLTGRGVYVSGVSHLVMNDFVTTIANHETGMVNLHLSVEYVAELPFGRSSWFRIATYLLADDGEGEGDDPNSDHVDDITSPKIWVNIK